MDMLYVIIHDRYKPCMTIMCRSPLPLPQPSIPPSPPLLFTLGITPPHPIIAHMAIMAGTWAKKLAKILFIPPSEHGPPPASR